MSFKKLRSSEEKVCTVNSYLLRHFDVIKPNEFAAWVLKKKKTNIKKIFNA